MIDWDVKWLSRTSVCQYSPLAVLQPCGKTEAHAAKVVIFSSSVFMHFIFAADIFFFFIRRSKVAKLKRTGGTLEELKVELTTN